MISHLLRSRLLRVVLGVCAVGLLAVLPTDARPDKSDRPRLVVMLVFDQLRGDYVEKWRALFGEGGFKRLEDEGAWLQQCHYPYANTVTGVGHATVGTGVIPAKHGIVGNDWYDRAAGKAAYCVGTERYERVPPAKATVTKDGKVVRPRGGASPERLLVPTFAERLSKATGGKAKIVSLSMKDRSAVLPVGAVPGAACYWFDTSDGTFITSTYYRETLHPWVKAFNAERPADAYFTKQWERLHPDLDYVRYSGPDEVKGEGKGIAQGLTFPHSLNGGPKQTKPGKASYEALYNSPFANDMLLGLMRRAVEAEQLGQDDVCDFLAVSFSANDPIGHCWGPDSQEVLDVTLRTDVLLKDLLAYLDARVGNGNYVLGLTADHGVCPLPEVSRKRGIDAARVSGVGIAAAAEEALQTEFGDRGGEGRWIEKVSLPWVYLNQKRVKAAGLESAAVEKVLAEFLAEQPGILRAYTRKQLEHPTDPGDAIEQRVRASHVPDRSGDVTAVIKPYYLLSGPLSTGTTHGSPHDYDTHVAMLLFGNGVKPGIHKEPTTPLVMAATFAGRCGIPADGLAPLPEGLLEGGR